MPSFYDTVLRNSTAFRSSAVCKDLALLEPGTRAAVLALLADAKAQGIDLRLLETYRSQTRQSALFMQHATQLRTVGCHGYGVAADFGVFNSGKYAEDNKPYVFLRVMARKHGLISGQDWGHATESATFVDSGHVQRVPVWRQDALFSGAWYPSEVYDPYQDEAAQHKDMVASLPSTVTDRVAAMPTMPFPVAPAKVASVAPYLNMGIIATVFGGASDHETSAYTGHRIDDTVLGVALPAYMPNTKIRVHNGGKSVVADVVDIGPWNTNDPYWETRKRPQAESGTDMRGRHTNRAGIDLTPATARALGIDGKGVVDWELA
jgi:D-alanyl-D-alanine carboxypeptidase